jgi:RNA polymerase sigma-70 factor (sigma-E family)
VEFDEYVAANRQALFRFAVVLTGDVVLADDVVADTLARAYEKWSRVRASASIHAYVRKMVVNEYLGWRRRAARHGFQTELIDVEDPASDFPTTHADQQQLAAELRLLPPKQRAALVLRYYEGLSFAEIAVVLGTGENAVRSNVSRALSRLRVQMTDDPADPLHRFPGVQAEARS